MLELSATHIIAEGGFPKFLTPEAQVLAWQIIVFFSLMALLWKFAWGPIMQALAKREHNIQKKIDDAEARFKEAEDRIKEYQSKIDKAKDEAAEIIAEGKRDVEKIKEEILAAARKEADLSLERAKREITLAKDAAVAELRDKMVDLTAQIATRVVEREIKPEDHRRYIADAIGQVESSKN